MKIFQATIQINASAETVWEIITDAKRYPEWDPGMVRIEGTIAEGEIISSYTKLSPNRAFKTKVTEFEPYNRMVWQGGMPLGLFKSVRVSSIVSGEDGSIQFTVEEKFSGLLLPLFGKMIPDLNPVFADFCKGLKERAEQG